MRNQTDNVVSQGCEGVNVAELITDITGINAKNQFYFYGVCLLTAIVIACLGLEGATPLSDVKFIAWRAYQMTGA
jgi:hypothetical protein